jgi:hypothetical protein
VRKGQNKGESLMLSPFVFGLVAACAKRTHGGVQQSLHPRNVTKLPQRLFIFLQSLALPSPSCPK